MLKDIAKILVGATATEMGWNIWLIAENMLPVKFMGFEFGFASIMAAVLVNFTLAIIFIYFGWLRKPKTENQENIEATKK